MSKKFLSTKEKIQYAKELVRDGAYVEAMRIVKTMKHLPAELLRVVEIAYEMCTVGEKFYSQLGYNRMEMMSKAVDMIKGLDD